ncbi:class I adenylate-forming enzyme family protein [[Mycobacterium] nativiensis]|uniref:Class I adenylate-forming enzyme family protein n=1 Tax=[Mycobacterium] nativiensis TaxID=2855503 RepID=A0ABU5XY30_9MYCO|nr:class I adenylate-forming enzyme family protein [Mycolicibacter sp. MYC340]MEB3032914.1 class I adenylate-forming enzyme family protein [Mycolicibacter sp. MYC340]
MPDWSSPAYTAAEVARYHAAGWWSQTTLSDAVRRNAQRTPDKAGYVDYLGETSLTWREFDAAADATASRLAGVGVAAGDRIAVWHRDSAAIHVLFVAIERCGAVVVGIGARAGIREVSAILAASQSKLLITDEQRHSDATGLGIETLSIDALNTIAEIGMPAPQLGADDVFLINSTSGTTGLPKCVVHTQNRWHYFHQLAVANGKLSSDDVFLPIIPTPFGFGLWTSHTTPIHLGVTAVLLDRFSAAATCAAIEQYRVSVLCCVSTQLSMMMADGASREFDLSSLRVVFTGGEALPYRPAAEFEALTGAKILQFYGSNETGVLSGTTLDDPLDRRLRTGGRIVPEMAVRLFDGHADVTDTGRGQPACRGPATSLGYLNGTDHDKLFTPDGWMLMGDICEIDADGYLSVTGRTSDFILRGGKNISAAQVEDAVMTHPAIAVAAAVAMPDEVFGEKVCVFVELADVELAGVDSAGRLELPDLVEHLLGLGVSKELLPERLVVIDELPRSSGGKIAKGQLREQVSR